MDDMDIMAAMGIAGFGKQKTQRQLDPRRFEKNKRDETVGVYLGRVFLHDTERPNRVQLPRLGPQCLQETSLTPAPVRP